jgi:hypothetical protein
LQQENFFASYLREFRLDAINRCAPGKPLGQVIEKGFRTGRRIRLLHFSAEEGGAEGFDRNFTKTPQQEETLYSIAEASCRFSSVMLVWIRGARDSRRE